MNQKRLTAYVRAAGSAFLLLILGVCGYLGTLQNEVKAVSVPIVRSIMEQEIHTASTVEETRQRFENRRKEEIALLDSIIAQSDGEGQSRLDALEQKMQIVQRMELEAEAQASLSYMGFDRAAVVCGAQSLTVFVPFDQAEDEKKRVRLLDAAASASGISPEAVKIILTKK